MGTEVKTIFNDDKTYLAYILDCSKDGTINKYGYKAYNLELNFNGRLLPEDPKKWIQDKINRNKYVAKFNDGYEVVAIYNNNQILSLNLQKSEEGEIILDIIGIDGGNRGFSPNDGEILNDENYIIKNIRNDITLKLPDSKKDSLCYVAKALLDKKFEAEFIGGVLGNIISEGEYGLFESSNYKSNPTGLPKYFKYMKEYLKDLNYDKEFSGKKISSVGLKKTCKLVDFTVKSKYQAKFGFGAAQFTGDRTTEIIKKYIEVCGNVTKEYIKSNYIKKDEIFLERACDVIFKGKEIYPTSEQMLRAESNLIVEELKGVEKKCYETWKNKYKNKDNAVNMAGQTVCKEYERPYDPKTQSIIRGKNAESIYKVMMKK